ncbi:MAG: hypothetical protein COX07_06340 [Bacteroidetes bacterium CG23_combo_of_CG06-09_8_20_14_all_32_9]|nr:MAG: hypothetical protein COX07_06340 [Bacteroidetes bacterium CG23_combo_of_CG06-09_8_20_14_all_32_9]
MKKFLISAILIVSITHLFSQNNELITFFEKSNYLETPRYDSTIAYCKKLADTSPLIHYTTFGISPEGRDLPLLIADKDKFFDPELIKKNGRTILLIQACIHAGEPDGKDAGLMLFRDFVINKDISKLLENVSVIFIPIYNVDGHERFGAYNRINQNGPKEMGWRTNASNLNLNRDYIKAEAPETKAWIELFNKWHPDFFIDCHVTDGSDYIYALTYGLEINGNMDSNLTKWQKNIYLPYVTKSMEKAGYPIFPYVSFKEWHNIESGLTSWVTPPMFSQGYTAMVNCPGLLIETHMLKNYKTRVFATYKMIEYTLDVLNSSGKELQQNRKQSDVISSSEEFRKKPFPLSFNFTRDSVIIDFKGMEYTSEKSDLTGGAWFKFGTKIKNYKLPYFNNIKPTAIANLPEYYVIPRQWSFIEDILRLHHINYFTLKNDTIIEVSGYRFNNVKFNSEPYEGRQLIISVKADTINYKMKLIHGSIIIPMNQPKSRLIAHILEPMSPASLLQFGYFNTIFEQKEYGESYILEPLAREMLANTPKIKENFEKELKDNPDFKNNSYALLNWFYIRSKYADNQQNVYPIGKIFRKSFFEQSQLLIK